MRASLSQKNLDSGRVLLSSSHVGLLEAIKGLLEGLLQGRLLGAIRGVRNRARTLAIATPRPVSRVETI
jgi:hypothetical protein